MSAGPQILLVDREAMGFVLQTLFESSSMDGISTSLSKESTHWLLLNKDLWGVLNLISNSAPFCILELEQEKVGAHLALLH